MSTESSQPIRPDIDRSLHEAFPQGVMALALDIQESHLAGVFCRQVLPPEGLGGFRAHRAMVAIKSLHGARATGSIPGGGLLDGIIPSLSLSVSLPWSVGLHR